MTFRPLSEAFVRRSWYSVRYLALHQANSTFHPSGVGKWVPAIAHSKCGWTCGCAGKLWYPLRSGALCQVCVPLPLSDEYITSFCANKICIIRYCVEMWKGVTGNWRWESGGFGNELGQNGLRMGMFPWEWERTGSMHRFRVLCVPKRVSCRDTAEHFPENNMRIIFLQVSRAEKSAFQSVNQSVLLFQERYYSTHTLRYKPDAPNKISQHANRDVYMEQEYFHVYLATCQNTCLSSFLISSSIVSACVK